MSETQATDDQDGIEPQEVVFREHPKASKEVVHAILKERRHHLKLDAGYAKRINELYDLAYSDPGTGLPNRAVLIAKLPGLIDVSRQKNMPLAVMILDVIGLKRTNDSVGHLAGDELLRSVSAAFKGLLRPDDVVGRYGGDEFYALLPGYEPMPDQTLEELNNSRIATIKGKFAEHADTIGIPKNVHVGLSIGIALLNENDDFETLIHRADMAEKAAHDSSRKELEEAGIHFDDPRV